MVYKVVQRVESLPLSAGNLSPLLWLLILRQTLLTYSQLFAAMKVTHHIKKRTKILESVQTRCSICLVLHRRQYDWRKLPSILFRGGEPPPILSFSPFMSYRNPECVTSQRWMWTRYLESCSSATVSKELWSNWVLLWRKIILECNIVT